MGKVITIGELMMRLTPKNKERLNQANEFKSYYGGAEANVAMSLSKFGHESSFLSIIPQNDIGDAALSYLAGGGVNTSWVFREGNRLGIYYYEEGYSLKQAKVIYDRDYSAIHYLPDIEIDWETVFMDIDILHITGITPALSEKMKDFTLKAIAEAKKFSLKVSFDFNYRGKLWSINKAKQTYLDILPYVDICFAGYKDFIYILGEVAHNSFSEKKLAKFFKYYTHKYDIEVFAATDRQITSATQNSIQGYLYQEGQLYTSEVYEFDILERIGGGDAFTAGILHGIMSSMDSTETVEFGTASGVLKHMVYGDHNRYTQSEIKEFLKNRGMDVSR